MLIFLAGTGRRQPFLLALGNANLSCWCCWHWCARGNSTQLRHQMEYATPAHSASTKTHAQNKHQHAARAPAHNPGIDAQCRNQSAHRRSTSRQHEAKAVHSTQHEHAARTTSTSTIEHYAAEAPAQAPAQAQAQAPAHSRSTS